MTDKVRYTIVDPRPIREENPWTFYIPCAARQNAVSPGDSVQLIFTAGEDDDAATERMWVEVTGKENGRLVGNLVNEPVILTMTYGEEIIFSAHEIIDIMTDRKDDPEETNGSEPKVFHRCYIDERVWNKTVPPQYARNGVLPPEDYNPGPMGFPWGGWMILGEGWKEGMPLTVGTPVIAIRQDPGIAEHLIGDDDPTIVEKIDGRWTSRPA